MDEKDLLRSGQAAGAGACLITDAWTGLDMFLAEGEEVLSARDGQDVAAILADLSRERAEAIGRQARERVLREHTYASRAEAVDRLFLEMLRPNRVEAAE